METTGLGALPRTQQNALHTVGILQLTDNERAGCSGVREARVILLLLVSVLSVGPISCNSPSSANSNNSSSGKPFWTLPYHKTTALSFICFSWKSLSRLCPRPDSDEICLITFPGHHRKPTTEHLPLGYAFSHSCIYHDDTCARKAQYPPKQCENHKLYFSSLFFKVSNLGAQCVPWSKSGYTTFGWT